MINYCRLSALTVQDERFSLSASHPLAFISRPVHLTRSAEWLYTDSLLVVSAVPNMVTAIIAANISDIPPIC